MVNQQPAPAEKTQQLFALFDSTGSHELSRPAMKMLVRATGRAPSEAELDAALGAQTCFSAGDAAQLLERLPARPEPAQLRAQLRDAFRVFDEAGSGRLPASQLFHILTSLGERLTDAEASAFIAQVADPSGSGTVEYEALLDRLVAG